MISLNLPKGAVAVGCGYLYAMPVADFKLFETTWETMTEIGYITEDGATFTRSAESNPLVTANYGKIGSTPSDYTTEFDTGVISLTKENLTVFSTGAATEDLTDGGYRMKFSEDDTPAEVALCFRCTDLKKGNECYSASFMICKKPFAPITNDEYRDLMRWLNRREFLQTYFIEHNDEESETVYYNASFSVEKEYSNFKLIALRLTMETDSPFGYGQEQTARYTVSDVTKSVLLSDVSDEIGYIYPNLTITIDKDGDLEIYNENTDCRTVIKNCVVGEVITIDGNAKIIDTSKDAHRSTLHNDFNFEFFKIGNTLDNRNNRIYFSLPCKCVLKYTPVIK